MYDADSCVFSKVRFVLCVCQARHNRPILRSFSRLKGRSKFTNTKNGRFPMLLINNQVNSLFVCVCLLCEESRRRKKKAHRHNTKREVEREERQCIVCLFVVCLFVVCLLCVCCVFEMFFLRASVHIY